MRVSRLNFIKFVVNILKILLSVLFVGTIAINISFFNGIDKATVFIALFYAIAIFSIYIIIKSNRLEVKHKVLIIMCIGIIARVTWLLNIKTAPYSDFEVLYSAAKDLANGNNREFTSNNYIARFHICLI